MIYMIEHIHPAGPMLVSSNKAVAPKRACDRYSDEQINEIFPPHVWENITPEAVIDHAISLCDKSYNELLALFVTTDSEVEREAIRTAIMAEDYTVEFLHDDAVMMVMRGGMYNGRWERRTWAKLYTDELRADASVARLKNDAVLAKFLDDLADDLEMTWAEFQAQQWQYKRNPVKW